MVRNKFQENVIEKISSVLALSQVEMAKKIGKVKKVLENIFSLYTIFFDSTLFT